MSNSGEDDVGYGKPPKKHQFSKQNQPRRRKRKAPIAVGHDVLANILHAVSEDVSVTMNGKSTKAKAGDVFARRLVKQGVGGSLNEQIKFANFLKSYGEFDPETIKKQIKEVLEQEYRDQLEEERTTNDKLLAYLTNTLDLVQGCRASFKAIADAYVGAKSACTCSSFDNYSEAEQAIIDWYQDDAPEHPDNEPQKCPATPNSGWAPSTHNNLGSGPAGYGDDLAAGMIGND